MNINVERVTLIPQSDELWKGIGGHFDSLSQILCEFIDNSISNFKANKLDMKTIYIKLVEDKMGNVEVNIEDTGTGIHNLISAFTLGSKDCLETPMNEHGFGMKHALATANLDNDDWIVCTRTKNDMKKRCFKKLEAPYKLEGFEINEVDEDEWPGKFFTTGTYIKFTCQKEMYKTLTKGLKGNHGFKSQTEMLFEDLGFIYSNIIRDGEATISIEYKSNNNTYEGKDQVKALEPYWDKYIGPKNGSEEINLGCGNVLLEYQFGIVKDADNKRYYKKSMNASGLEIRLNGRVIEYNLFSDIWGIDRHNSYNTLLIIINLISKDKNLLPITRSSKNGIRQGDPKLSKLIEWVRVKLPKPLQNTKHYDDELDLFKQLKELKITHMPEPKEVQRERAVFTSLNDCAKMDLFIAIGDKYYIYEGKRDKTTIQDAYQLKMYWDGCVIDGLLPYEAYLIASNHPKSVKQIIDLINDTTDIKGNPYNLRIKLWKDEGIIIED